MLRQFRQKRLLGGCGAYPSVRTLAAYSGSYWSSYLEIYIRHYIRAWPNPVVRRAKSERQVSVESECGAVALGRPYLLPPLSSGGASLGRPWLPFPHPAHRTGHADLPHPALGQDVTPSPTTGRVPAVSAVRARNARKGARVDKLRPCVA